jgi:hypothetical protein
LHLYPGSWLYQAHVAQFLWKWSSSWIFSSAVTSAAVILWFFLNNPSQYAVISFCRVIFDPLFLFDDVFFPWFM